LFWRGKTACSQQNRIMIGLIFRKPRRIKINQANMSVFCKNDVGRLNIPVNDSAAMQIFKNGTKFPHRCETVVVLSEILAAYTFIKYGCCKLWSFWYTDVHPFRVFLIKVCFVLFSHTSSTVFFSLSFNKRILSYSIEFFGPSLVSFLILCYNIVSRLYSF